MYVPNHFAADEANALIARLARRWAGVLVSVDASGTPVATHLPILWDAEKRAVSGHIARANPHWNLGEGRGLLVLNGPEAYVTPSWYPSKAEHGKTVPTWNYEAVHFNGRVESTIQRGSKHCFATSQPSTNVTARSRGRWTMRRAPTPKPSCAPLSA